jgi:hypothetical protein
MWNYRDNDLFMIHVYEGDTWWIYWAYDGIEGAGNIKADEHLQKFAQEHVKICGHFKSNGKDCGCGNQPGKRVSIFGKEFDNICGSIEFGDASAEELKYIIKVVELTKDNIDDKIV